MNVDIPDSCWTHSHTHVDIPTPPPTYTPYAPLHPELPWTSAEPPGEVLGRAAWASRGPAWREGLGAPGAGAGAGRGQAVTASQ